MPLPILLPVRYPTFAAPEVPLVEPETETTTAVEVVDEADTHLDKPWNVVLLDDDYHTYDYVIEMLHSIFGYTIRKAFLMAVEVDSTGRVVVWSGHRELAEMKQAQIHEYGPDWRMDTSKGSMSAILEPAG